MLGASFDSKRFLNYFERIKLSFETGGQEEFYPPVDWVKAKTEMGGTFDCFEITRAITREQKKRLGDQTLKLNLQFFLENNPRRYRVSPQLSKVLGGIEETTRLQLIGALWQYVKSNRL
jgi:SWIB/MDM2 domain